MTAIGFLRGLRGGRRRSAAGIHSRPTEGPIVLLALEQQDAVAKWREVMGATDPAKAAEGAIRKLYGSNIGRNASHGSDSPENAAIGLGWFFRGSELG